MIIDFMFWVLAVALATAFVLGLSAKWGIIEKLQVNAPTDFLNRLFNCKFCCSFWMGLAISLGAAVTTGWWGLLTIPIFSTVIARELW